MLISNEQIVVADTQQSIADCFSVVQELRPTLRNKKSFVDQILRQKSQGYILAYIRENSEVAACIGFRMFETLAWGKLLYIDDLITREKSRKNGFASALLTYAIEQGRANGCAQTHLDSGHQRHDAHRLYLNHGFRIDCHHLALILQ